MEVILAPQRLPKLQAHPLTHQQKLGQNELLTWPCMALKIKLFVFQVVKKRNSELSALGFEEFDHQDWNRN